MAETSDNSIHRYRSGSFPTRRTSVTILTVGVLTTALVAIFQFRRPSTPFNDGFRKFHLTADSTRPPLVAKALRGQGMLARTFLLEWALRSGLAGGRVKPGTYRIHAGMSQYDVLRLLARGRQETVRYVITKYRTPEDMAGHVGRLFACDSADMIGFLTSPDSLSGLGLDTDRVMTVVVPNTYELYWGSTAGSILRRLQQESSRFWTEERKARAQRIGLTPEQVYVMASIIEEETNIDSDKPLIASVYLNRLHRGMTLSADPTVKFALRDFGLKRILFGHIDRAGASPYNTYRSKGLPPGPICTPSIATIEGVLNAKDTDYLFFCARPDLSGRHAFAATEAEHFRNARRYQAFLDSLYAK
jgi:UPF0755 protein